MTPCASLPSSRRSARPWICWCTTPCEAGAGRPRRRLTRRPLVAPLPDCQPRHLRRHVVAAKMQAIASLSHLWASTEPTSRRKSTVRQAEVHIKLVKEHFGAVPMASGKPSDVRRWTAQLKAEGRADSYAYALHARLSQLLSDAVHDGIVPRNPCSRRTSPGTGKQRPYVQRRSRSGLCITPYLLVSDPRSCSALTPGCGFAEAVALRPEDVDIDKRR